MSVWDDSGYDQSWAAPGGGYTGGGYGGAFLQGGDTNPAGAADDPFAYTHGSLLTPWEGHFNAPAGSGGGPAVPAYTPFQYQDFNFQARDPGTFGEVYSNPGNFVYGDYQGVPAFKAPTEKDMRADPGYQFSVDQGMKALQASKAAQGILKTGGTAKALVKYGQDMGSQQYDKVYGRKMGEYQLGDEQRRFTYGTNRQNATENYDRNINNQRQAYQIRQGTWRDNAAATQSANELNYNIATGTYDRNEQKARQSWEDAAAHAAAMASAANAGSQQAYDRALNQYTMARDEFWTNQDRQYAILSNQDALGRDAAYRYGDTSAGLAMQRGDAQASGRVGAGNAWAAGYGGVGNTLQDYGMYTMRYGLPRAQTSQAAH